MSATVEQMFQPFVRVVEVWVPDGAVLRFHSGAYGAGSAAFGRGAEDLTFGAGEGLPGAAFSERRPVLWRELDTRFVRRELAALVGLDAGVAFPLFRGDQVAAVIVLLCGSREHTGGCVEIWEPNDLRELALAAGYYGRLQQFGEISRLLRFQRGVGLPGITWQRGLPHIIPELGGSNAFVRAAAARTSGVHAGLGIPLYRASEVAHVLLLLSAQVTPLARAFEVWTAAPSGELELAECYDADALEIGEPTPRRGAGEQLARLVWRSGLPLASAAPHALITERGTPALPRRFRLALGLPIHDGERVRAVVNILN